MEEEIDFDEKVVAPWWITSAKCRTMLVAIFNFVIRIMEMVYQVTSDKMEFVVHTGFSYHGPDMVLRVLPIILGVILLIGVLQDHYGGCMIWCVGEIANILIILCSYWIDHGIQLQEYNDDLLLYTYCALRLLSLSLVCAFMRYLKEEKIIQEKIDEILLRNHFWYQLSLLHAENAKKSKKQVTSCPSPTIGNKDKNV